MNDPTAAPIERRAVPGSTTRFSSVTISVDPATASPPATQDRTVTLLRRARERGVTTFDVADVAFPAAAERLLRTAFPEPDPELGVIVGRSVETLARGGSVGPHPNEEGALAEALEVSLQESQRRLGEVRVVALEWSVPPSVSARRGSPSASRPAWPRDAKVLRILRSSSPTREDDESPPQLIADEFSLLDTRWARERPDLSPTTAGLVARNPFASGRLDGSRFAVDAGLRPAGVGPIDLRRLHEEFDPVLQLGFLTRERRRTLAQAALRFVLAWPWVTTAVVPLPTPERLGELLSFTETPELSEEELVQLGLVK